jgi:hypothetical protein
MMESAVMDSTDRIESVRKPASDIYFSADVETDGPIPGPFSLLSFALVYAGRFDGSVFQRPIAHNAVSFYRELKPISDQYQLEALSVNGLDRDRLKVQGQSPDAAMNEASEWVKSLARGERPVLVAYPLSFDWSWLYWYFVRFAKEGSPFSYSQCFDLKTAFAIKARRPIAQSGRSELFLPLRSRKVHSHNALDDAFEQAEIFANLFEWGGPNGSSS